MVSKKVCLFLSIVICTSCLVGHKTIKYNAFPAEDLNLDIHEGMISQRAQRIKYKRGGETCAIIKISKPIMVAQADREEKWGYFQFPDIGITEDGILVVGWQMSDDSHKAYGKSSRRKYTPMISKNNGRTWYPQDKVYDASFKGSNIIMSNNVKLQVKTPESKYIKTYTEFPQSVGRNGSYSYYKEEQLPEDLRGVYFNYSRPRADSKVVHAILNDPGLLRYAIDDLMPIVWWGDIKELDDHSIVAGIYPTYYLDDKGIPAEGGVSFYKSKDEGYNWDVLSKIPFIKDGIADVKGDKVFTEPAFEILKDSTFICIMRSGSSSPMYRSFSYDKGVNWTKPEPFTPNGVKPKLLLLKNGVLVLSSGRPGIQLRFSLDGMGKQWTAPIDMIPFMNADGTYTRDVSCGYTSIIEADNESFYLVYSDFTTFNYKRERRKTIWFRKISVSLKH